MNRSRLRISDDGQQDITANTLRNLARLAASTAWPYLRCTVEWIKQLAVS